MTEKEEYYDEVTNNNYDDMIEEEVEEQQTAEEEIEKLQEEAEKEAAEGFEAMHEAMVKAKEAEEDRTETEVLHDAAVKAIEEHWDGTQTPAEIRRAVFKRQKDEIRKHNAIISEIGKELKKDVVKIPLPRGITPATIALIIMKTRDVINVTVDAKSIKEEDRDLLAFYDPDDGIYGTGERRLKKLIREYDAEIRIKGVKEVIDILETYAERREQNNKPYLVAVDNGIFNTKTMELMPFSPKYVFLSKCRVGYNAAAKPVEITNPDGTIWTVDGWIEDMMDGDQEKINSVWESIAATVKPLINWRKNIYYYSQEGNNGKGTICKLIKNLIGEDSYLPVALEDLDKQFYLETLPGTQAIINDENNVGEYIDKSANAKRIATKDPLLITRKNKTAVVMVYNGVMIQCINSLPRTKDKTESKGRRDLYIHFTKSYTGKENKLIQDEYIKRKDVLEYVLKRVLAMTNTELHITESSRRLAEQASIMNSSVKAFWVEMSSQFAWGMLPLAFAYDLYAAWYKRNYPGAKAVGKETFIEELQHIIAKDDEWEMPPKRWNGKKEDWPQIRTGNRMDGPEPLIFEYGLQRWRSPTYIGPDIMKMCCPKLAVHYRGAILRK